MRNKIKLVGATVGLVCAVVFVAAPAFAEDSNSQTTDTHESPKQKLEQERHDKIEKLKTERINHEKNRISGLQMVAQNEISRAQKEADRLANIVVRLKALRAKLSTDTTVATPDLSKIDEMISKADALKTKIDNEITDAKTKQAAIIASLPKVESSINTTTTENSQVDHTAAPTPVVTSVKDFQASIKILKKDLIALHTSLQQISKAMRAIKHAAGKDDDSSQPTSTNEEENQ